MSLQQSYIAKSVFEMSVSFILSSISTTIYHTNVELFIFSCRLWQGPPNLSYWLISLLNDILLTITRLNSLKHYLLDGIIRQTDKYFKKSPDSMHHIHCFMTNSSDLPESDNNLFSQTGHIHCLVSVFASGFHLPAKS